MEYIKTYIILYKSNTRVIYFSYMLNHTFILTDCREVSVCIQYDIMLVFLKWNGKILMKWLSQPVSVHVITGVAPENIERRCWGGARSMTGGAGQLIVNMTKTGCYYYYYYVYE